MSEKYLLISEFGDASCSVDFEKDEEDGFIHLNFNLSEVDVDEQDWEMFGKIVSDCKLWKNNLYYIVERCKGLNWAIHLYRPNGNGNATLLECYGNPGPSIDLGILGECYDDCEQCDRCHNYRALINRGEWETDEDDTHSISPYDFCRYHCEGCDEHPCTRVNGREALERAVSARDVI